MSARSRRSLGAAIAILLVVTTGAVGMGHGARPVGTPTPARLDATAFTGQVRDAVASLAAGSGPAGGAPLVCSPRPGGSADCSSSPASAPGSASPGWANLTGRQNASPPARSYGRSLAYDPTDGYVVLFGGYTPTGYLGDTWEFAHGEWTKLNPSPAPAARDHSSLVWDAPAGYLLLFGGSNSAGALSDTWSFLNGTWTFHPETTHPSARWSTSMTYDASDGYVLLFGGCSGTDVSDTWKFSNDSWTQLSPAHHPSNRGDAQMTYDPSDGYVVLFGGDDYGPIYADTWTFHAGNWTELSPAVAPAARSEGSIAYDSELGAVILYGGMGLNGYLGDTWTFVAGNWTMVSVPNGPGPRAFGIMTDDPADGYVLLFSGAGVTVYELDDTWALYGINVTASLSASTATAPANVTLTAAFTDPFTTPQFAWQFGDGTTGSGAVVNHTYAAPGLYYASVSGNDPNGAVASSSVVFSATFPFSVVASVTPLNGTVPYPIALSAAGIGGLAPYAWHWTLPNGSVATTPDVNLTLTIPGTFPVALAATDSAGASFDRSFTVTGVAPQVVPLAVTIVAAPLIGEAPLPVEFQTLASGGNGPYTYAWDFGDAGAGSGAAVDHTYLAGGTFGATVTVTDAAGHSTHESVSVVVASAVWAFGIVSPNPGPALRPVTFTGEAGSGAGPYEFAWSFGDGNSSTSQNASHAYATGGVFPVQLTVSDANGRQATWATNLTVSAAPVTPGPSPAPTSTAGGGPSTLVVLVGEIVGGAVAIAAIIAYATRRRR